MTLTFKTDNYHMPGVVLYQIPREFREGREEGVVYLPKSAFLGVYPQTIELSGDGVRG